MSDIRSQLNTFGSNTGKAPLEKEEIIYKDTIFVNPSSVLIDTDLFISDGKDSMYRNAAFPITSHAYEFTHVRVCHNLAFNVPDPKLQNVYLQHFEEHSNISFQRENKVIGVGLPFSALMETTWGDLGAVAATGTILAPKAKFASWYQLGSNASGSIKLGAGMQFKVTFNAAKGLESFPLTADTTPYVPNAGAIFACANRGHWIQVQLRGYRWLESAS